MEPQKEVKNYQWQRSPPDAIGDWLWVDTWGCGCCVHSQGIEFVVEHEQENYLKLPSGLYISWPHKDRKIEDVAGWMKIELPAKEWSKFSIHKQEE